MDERILRLHHEFPHNLLDRHIAAFIAAQDQGVRHALVDGDAVLLGLAGDNRNALVDIAVGADTNAFSRKLQGDRQLLAGHAGNSGAVFIEDRPHDKFALAPVCVDVCKLVVRHREDRLRLVAEPLELIGIRTGEPCLDLGTATGTKHQALGDDLSRRETFGELLPQLKRQHVDLFTIMRPDDHVAIGRVGVFRCVGQHETRCTTARKACDGCDPLIRKDDFLHLLQVRLGRPDIGSLG